MRQTNFGLHQYLSRARPAAIRVDGQQVDCTAIQGRNRWAMVCDQLARQPWTSVEVLDASGQVIKEFTQAPDNEPAATDLALTADDWRALLELGNQSSRELRACLEAVQTSCAAQVAAVQASYGQLSADLAAGYKSMLELSLQLTRAQLEERVAWQELAAAAQATPGGMAQATELLGALAEHGPDLVGTVATAIQAYAAAKKKT